MAQPGPIIALRKQLVAAGYIPLPLTGKIPAIGRWQRFGTAEDVISDAEIEHWSTPLDRSKHHEDPTNIGRCPFATNTGLDCSHMPTLDFDLGSDIELTRAAWALIKERFEERGFVVFRAAGNKQTFQQRPKFAVPFRTDVPFPHIEQEFVQTEKEQAEGKDALIEVRGARQQIAAFGLHPNLREPYRWLGGTPGEIAHEDLPYISHDEAVQLVADLTDLAEQYGRKRKGALADSGAARQPNGRDHPWPAKAPRDLVAAALEIIPNDDLSWNDWNRVAMATYAATEGVGFELFNRWSAKSNKYTAKATAAKWQALTKCPPKSIGAGTLVYLANQHEPGFSQSFGISPEEDSDPGEPPPYHDEPPRVGEPGSEWIPNIGDWVQVEMQGVLGEPMRVREIVRDDNGKAWVRFEGTESAAPAHTVSRYAKPRPQLDFKFNIGDWIIETGPGRVDKTARWKVIGLKAIDYEPYLQVEGRNDCIHVQFAELAADQSEGPPRLIVGDRELCLRVAAEVKQQAVQWLWYGHLAYGFLEILSGAPEQGKTQILYYIAARVSNGLPWPGEDKNIRRDLRKVMLLTTAEESIEHTVIPRLIAAGANMGNVIIPYEIRISKKFGRLVLLGKDYDLLEMALKIHQPAFLGIDPITAHMGSSTDSYKATDVRAILSPLKEIVERCRVAGGIVTHPPKNNPNPTAQNQFIGSQAFIALARIGHIVAPEIDENGKPTGRRYFANAKNNLTARQPTLTYRILPITTGYDEDARQSIESSHVVFDDNPVSLTAEQILANTSKKRGPEAFDREKAETFLKEILANGPVESKVIRAEADELGISKSTLYRAADVLKVIRKQSGLGKTASHTWELPVANIIPFPSHKDEE